ncbi:hypothetical protein B0H14DRAFT_2628876 [Mycena olivaceomarginata]|nr:hypothetical protein B0H14DRAFT_2628876 [Mycena olivaceomarginata]
MPEWFPGPAFKTKRRNGEFRSRRSPRNPSTRRRDYFIDSNWVPAQQEAGKDSASLTSSRLDKLSQHPDAKYCRDMEKAISNVGGTAYVGGFETTSSTLAVFILAMMSYPTVQQRAHAELDRIVGSKRMP